MSTPKAPSGIRMSKETENHEAELMAVSDNGIKLPHSEPMVDCRHDGENYVVTARINHLYQCLKPRPALDCSTVEVGSERVKFIGSCLEAESQPLNANRHGRGGGGQNN